MHIEIPLRNSQGFHFPFRTNGWVAIHRGFFDSHNFLANVFLFWNSENRQTVSDSWIFGPFAGLELLKDKGDIFEKLMWASSIKDDVIFLCVRPKVMHISIYIQYIYYIDYTSSTIVTQKAHLVISLAFFHGSCDLSHVSPLTTFGRCPSSSAHSRLWWCYRAPSLAGSFPAGRWAWTHGLWVVSEMMMKLLGIFFWDQRANT